MRCKEALNTSKGEASWGTREARKKRKRARNRTPKNRNKKKRTSLISSPEESLNRNFSLDI